MQKPLYIVRRWANLLVISLKNRISQLASKDKAPSAMGD